MVTAMVTVTVVAMAMVIEMVRYGMVCISVFMGGCM